VAIRKIQVDEAPLPRRYDPTHPAADADGNVVTSNVQPVIEMVDMMSANRAYEANLNAFKTAKEMIQAALEIGRV
jgi:flagellar basal-body rod protein FlgC